MPGRYKPIRELTKSALNRAKRRRLQEDAASTQSSSDEDVHNSEDKGADDISSDEAICDPNRAISERTSSPSILSTVDGSTGIDQPESSNDTTLTEERSAAASESEHFSGSDSDTVIENDQEGENGNEEAREDLNDELIEEDYEFSEEDDDEHPDFDPVQQDLDQPLYDGANITVAESVVATLDLSLRHNITGALLAGILQLIALHLPPNHRLKVTLYMFYKYFADMKVPLVRHFYCKICHSSVELQNAVCQQCEGEPNNTYFIEGSIIDQIKAFFQRPGFIDKMQNRFTRDRQNPDSYEDIYDGKVYQELTENDGFLADGTNISLMWYTDGISIFKSSKFCIWPLYLVINELPFSERTKKENVIFAGLWFGEDKPLPNLFLRPLDSSLEILRQGIEVRIPNTDIPLNVKGLVICGTCDLPAKALFLNMKQFNGRFGCQKCTQEGEYLAEARVRVYSYEPLNLRTDEETIVHAEEAFEAGMAVCGVKGPTILSSMVYQCMRATAVDMMHCVFEGVVKALLKYWFSPDFSGHPSSIAQSIELVDRRLCSLTPPSFVQILPRSIKIHLSYWHAHEFKAWFFHYSIPCVHDIMEDVYFQHYLLLVYGVSLLCQSSITPEGLYYRRNMSNNVHQILHLAENVRQFGPLWTTSCFPLEDLNGQLKRLVHGSNSAQLQIYEALSKILILTTLKRDKLIPGRPAYEFCENLTYKRGRIKRHQVRESVYIVGICTKVPQLPLDINETLQRAGVAGMQYFKYHRLLIQKTMYMSTEYRRAKKTNSTYALYTIPDEPDRVGKIRCFIRVLNCPCIGTCNCEDENYAILNPCVLQNPFVTCLGHVLPTIHEVSELQCDEVAVNIAHLKAVCYYCKIHDSGKEFVIEPVNSVETE